MAKRTLLTEETRRKAMEVLKKRASTPAPPREKTYTQRELFQSLKSEIRAALDAGHSWDTIVADLKGVGLGLSVPSAKQYMKPGKKQRKNTTKQSNATVTTSESQKPRAAAPGKGKFEAVEDTPEI
jgi:hypothetical protein